MNYESISNQDSYTTSCIPVPLHSSSSYEPEVPFRGLTHALNVANDIPFDYNILDMDNGIFKRTESRNNKFAV